MNEKVSIVIPARIGSSRFPKKPLALLKGVAMIERVWRIAKQVKSTDEVLIATDSEEIKNLAEGFGAKVVMTSENCRTGTDRIFEAVEKQNSKSDIVLSFQGDSPLTPPNVLEETIKAIKENKEVQIATPACHLVGEALEQFTEKKLQGSSTGTVVVFDKNYDALYFSKTLLPTPRDGSFREIYKHIGIYAYRIDTLKRFTELEVSRLESIEKLEQLRALENGIPIKVVVCDLKGRTLASVDNPEDVAEVEAIINSEGELF